MNLKVNPKIRASLYVLTAVGTPVMAYLLAKHIVGDLEMTLWSAEVTVVSALAAFKTNLDEE